MQNEHKRTMQANIQHLAILKDNINQELKMNEERMVQIHVDREVEIEEHMKCGANNKALVEDMTRKSVADL